MIRLAKMTQVCQEQPLHDRLYRFLFEQMAEGICLLDQQGKVLDANPALCHLAAYSRSELLQLHGVDLFDPLPTQREPWPVHFSGESAPAGNACWLRRKDGTRLSVDACRCQIDEHHTLILLKANPTANATEERLRISEANYRLLFETTRDAIFVGGPNGVYVDVNPAAAQLLGLPRDQIIGIHYSKFIPATWLEYAQAVGRSIRATGYWQGEFPMLRPDGAIIWTEYHSQFDGQRVLGVARDITARKQAEAETARLTAAIQQERERLASLVANVPGVVWEAWGQPDAQTQRIDFVSDYVETMLGYRVAEWLATPNFWLLIVHPEDQAKAAQTAAEQFQCGQGGVNQFRWITKDGRILACEAVASVIKDETGRPIGMRGITFDRTELKQTEEALRRSEERFAKAFQASPQPMCITHVADGSYLDVNESFARLVGYPYEEIIGRTSFDVGIWRDPQARAAANRPIIEQGSMRDFAHRFYNRDGEVRDIISAGVLIEVGGQPCILSVVNDVTAHKQAEERLQTLYALSEAVNRADKVEEVYTVALAALRRVLAVNRASILLLDETGVMRFCAWDGLSDAYRQQAEGHSPWTVDEAHPQPVLIADAPQADLGVLRATVLQEGIGALAFIPLVEHGRLLGKFMLYYDQPHVFTENEVQLAQALARHVAHAIQRKQTEDLLRQSNEDLDQRVRLRTLELERSNRELDQFAYVASHDLKTPLRGITQLAQWISEDAEAVLPAASKVHLVKLRSRIQRMEKLLDDLLAYSRADRSPYSKERVEARVLVQNIVELLAPPATFTITIGPALPTLATARVPLETVLRNLIDNAIKHHDRPDGHVHVTAQMQREFIKFTVTDDGPGIDAPYHERIFGLFQTLKPRDVVEGSGMGLAIAQKIVEHWGGVITIESAPGQGATFHFTWPIE